MGFRPHGDEEASLLFDVVCRRHEHGSIIPASNKTHSERTDVFSGNEVVVTAILDWLPHYSKSFALKGGSYRMKGFKEGG